jgi:hypothetical protein
MRLILLLLLFLILLPSRIFSETLYDGETLLYGGSVKWDSNGSTLSESTLMPLSPPNHLRASLVNVDYWGAAGYVINRWNPIDLTPYKTLSIGMKADAASYAVGIQLFDGDQKSSISIKVDPLTTYDIYTIPLSAFEGVDLAKIKVIVFSVSRKGTSTHVIDIDDITADKEILPPPEDPS